ncbi:Enhancer of mRNA-decapping protein 4 [Toxocara canis]|uniref:Enhancer of mRNA-decapping protein 4 n=1 Tax=Toxocara canis TaxID=6265 RepID=A0A0B2VY95_TOXCA|nr:Enhancer of mRNA-decapping protein 4 [Toxocara canis]
MAFPRIRRPQSEVFRSLARKAQSIEVSSCTVNPGRVEALSATFLARYRRQHGKKCLCLSELAECATGVDQPLTQRGQLNNNQTDLAARLDSPKSNSREDYSDMTDQLFIPLDEIGETVELITLSTVKAEIEGEEVSIDKLVGVSDALIRIPSDNISSAVRTVCISPDATAVAVAQSAGCVSFFIIDGVVARFAHQWQPDSPWPIQDLIFLDNIDVNSETPEQFWKFAIAANDGGRRLDLYESESWRCIGRLRFESADRLSRFSVSVDPSARFLFLADYDAANVHCVELAYVGGVPHFSSCTQITFCHPLVNVVPCSITSNSFSGDVSLEDEEVPQLCIVANLIALSQRSLLRLEIDLETVRLDQAFKESPQSKLLAVATADNSDREKDADGAVSQRSEKENEILEIMQTHLENLAVQLERQADEADRQRRDDRARTDALIQQLKDEMVLRDERMLLKFESLIQESRSATVEAIQTSLELKMDGVAETFRASTSQHQQGALLNDELVKNVRGAMMSVVVPALDTLCSNLFQQLNESFRSGLEQYMRQMRSLHQQPTHAGTPQRPMVATDAPSLIQLIEAQQIVTAFEMALTRKDLSALMFVCNNVDPETLFGTEQPLPQAILLCILNQLAVKLEGETDLKFRYIENCLMALRIKDPTIANSYRQVLERLHSSLSAFMSQEANSNYKRQSRIILQLIMNMLK